MCAFATSHVRRARMVYGQTVRIPRPTDTTRSLMTHISHATRIRTRTRTRMMTSATAWNVWPRSGPGVYFLALLQALVPAAVVP